MDSHPEGIDSVDVDVDVDGGVGVVVVPPRSVDVLPAGLVVRGLDEDDDENEEDTREVQVKVDATLVGLGVPTEVVLTTTDEVFDDDSEKEEEEEDEEDEEDLAVDEGGAGQALSKYASGPSGSPSKLPLKGMLNSRHSLPPYPKLWQPASLAQRAEQAAYVEYLPLPL